MRRPDPYRKTTLTSAFASSVEAARACIYRLIRHRHVVRAVTEGARDTFHVVGWQCTLCRRIVA